MSSIIKFLIMFGLSACSLQAQDLSSYKLLAHYPLINSTSDVTGNNDTVFLANAPFQDLEGIYSNGIYRDTDPTGSAVETPWILALDHRQFIMSIEFKLTDTITADHSIFIGGRSWRFLGAAVSAGQELELVVNTIGYEVGFQLERDRWYTIAMKYQESDSLASLYLDNSLIFTRKEVLETDPDDKKFTNFHGGSGNAFLGNLRHMKIYGSGNAISWFEDETSWIYRWNTLGGFGYEQLNVRGDTVIQGQPCKIVQPILVMSEEPFAKADSTYRDPHFLYESNDSVFYFFSSTFFLLYNFNMLPGDSIDYPALVFDPLVSCPPVTFVLDSTVATMMGGESRRKQYGRIWIDEVLDENHSYVITEGIGFTHRIRLDEGNSVVPVKFGHLVPENAFTCTVDADAWQFCSYRTPQFSYNPGDEDCRDDLILPVDEVSFDDVSVSPNPTSGRINVFAQTRAIESVRIYAVDGRLIGEWKNQPSVIDLQGEKPGIYFLQVFTDRGVKVVKLIRQ